MKQGLALSASSTARPSPMAGHSHHSLNAAKHGRVVTAQQNGTPTSLIGAGLLRKRQSPTLRLWRLWRLCCPPTPTFRLSLRLQGPQGGGGFRVGGLKWRVEGMDHSYFFRFLKKRK